MKNFRVLLQYEGTRFKGWQRQESTDNTIQGRLEQLISRMCQEPIEIQGSGRTDAGVHALGQIFNFHSSTSMSCNEMRDYINQYLPEDIAVLEVAEVPIRFHSRLNAKGKKYSYHINNSVIPNVFWRKYSIMIEKPLDIQSMKRAADFMIGTHDFKSFTSTKKGKKSTIRTIESISIVQEREMIHITFKGDGFLYHMIRILVGTMIEIGLGDREPESIITILEKKNREEAGYLVPAKGLILEKVYYE